MKKVTNINPFQPIASLLNRFNLVSFIVIITGGLIASIMILNNILVRSYDETNTSGTTNSTVTGSSFDQSTINRLLKLETSSSNVNYKTLPSGRNNPFSE